MTPERFEELVEIGASATVNALRKHNGHPPLVGPVSEIDDGKLWLSQTSDALTAVLPLVRNEVIEECAVIVEDDDGHFTWAGEDKHVRLLQGFASDAATAIRALKTKDTKL